MHKYILMTNLNKPKDPRWKETFTKADDSVEELLYWLHYVDDYDWWEIIDLETLKVVKSSYDKEI